MKVLVLGHRSFAAQGLKDKLRAAGHDVVCFSRGPVAQENGIVTGPIEALASNPNLQSPFDTVINYILLKDDGIEKNNAYIDAVLELCNRQQVKHLIHISSVSSYQAGIKHIDEQAPTEAVPLKKGSYGSLKVATDLHLLEKLKGSSMKLSLIRPGFILGPGVVNPIVGTAARLPWNKILIIGSSKSIMPLIRRDSMHEALAKTVAEPPQGAVETLLLVAANSPSRWDFIQACCQNMGIGKGPTAVPVPLWYMIAASAEVTARLIGQGKMQPFAKLSPRLVTQSFSATQTEKRLGMDFTFDWPPVLRDAMEGQTPNFDLPPKPTPLQPTRARQVSFLGYGRIVKQRHLPALQALGFSGAVNAYDLRPGKDANGQEIQAIAGAKPGQSDLFVVASPGPAHIQSMEPLRDTQGAILLEKPLGYSTEELQQWLAFAKQRREPTMVCHNYRFKDNVRRMAALLHECNPGALKHINVFFQSPPVSNDSAPWLRAERKARTLLMDYSLHFLDLACMFGRGPWKVDGVRHEIDWQGNTGLIEGRLLANYSVSFLLRQGFAPRRARLLLNFQNYTVSLGFFPDTFAVYMADDNPWQYKAEKKESLRGLLAKIRDKLTHRESDLSHAVVFAGAIGQLPEVGASLELPRVAAFYEMLFELSHKVYDVG